MSHENQKAQIEANSAALMETAVGEAINDAARMIAMRLIKQAHMGEPGALPASFTKAMQLGDMPPIYVKIVIAHSEDELE